MLSLCNSRTLSAGSQKTTQLTSPRRLWASRLEKLENMKKGKSSVGGKGPANCTKKSAT